MTGRTPPHSDPDPGAGHESSSPSGRSPKAAALAARLPWAVLIGVAASLVLLGVSELAERVQHLVWNTVPDVAEFDGGARWWIVAVLTCAGLLVGLTVRYVPGHAGPDPATEGLVGPPMPVRMVPSVLLALVLTLAGGVSLGPENPITACNIALACWFGAKLGRGTPEGWLALGAAGTIGALFATPVAAALVLSELLGKPEEPLWDRLFAPLTAATAGAVTTYLAAQPVFSVDVPGYPGLAWSHLLYGTLIALSAACLMLAVVYTFPHVYRLFQRLGHPVLMLTCGGLVLGLLGALGGRLTLFKGLDQMREITGDLDGHSAGNLAMIAAVKAAALTVAAASGFRGGRIFPALFIGAVTGVCAHALFPGLPVSLTLVCGVLGAVLPVTRQAWLSLFLAAVTVPDLRLFPVLCLVSLPIWLLVTDRPPMLVRPRAAEKSPA